MDGVAFARGDLKWSHELFRMTTADVTSEQAHWIPPGIANPLGATYAHAVCGEDAIFRVLILGEEPLFSTSWAGRTGISEPRWGSESEWARTVTIDLDQARQYAEEVFSMTESYLEGVTADELDRIVDLTERGFGEQTVAWILQALMISHLNSMSGEISCLKGLQGATGYPF